jgi:hypothetical protein
MGGFFSLNASISCAPCSAVILPSSIIFKMRSRSSAVAIPWYLPHKSVLVDLFYH